MNGLSLHVGSAVADLLILGPWPEVFSEDVTYAESVRLSPGGDALNQAFAVASLGLPCRLVGKMGDDDLGRFLLTKAEKLGVDTSCMIVSPEVSTSLSTLLVQKDGSRHIIGSRYGAGSTLKAAEIADRCFEGVSLVSIGSLYSSRSITGELCEDVLTRAKAAGCVTVLDMMYKKGVLFEDAVRAIRCADFFLPNRDEALQLAETDDPDEAAARFLAAGAKTVVIKCGAEGCLLYHEGEKQLIPGFPANAVDTTGAGDTFTAGFIAGLRRELPLIRAIRLGHAAGAVCVEQIGAGGNLPPLAELNKRFSL